MNLHPPYKPWKKFSKEERLTFLFLVKVGYTVQFQHGRLGIWEDDEYFDPESWPEIPYRIKPK